MCSQSYAKMEMELAPLQDIPRQCEGRYFQRTFVSTSKELTLAGKSKETKSNSDEEWVSGACVVSPILMTHVRRTAINGCSARTV
jgi:hypothetical protein